MESNLASSAWPARTALFIAHPGHELRVWSWLGRTRPVTFVVTDGSGRAGTSRIATTARLLRRREAPIGDLFGGWTDRELYAAVLAGDAGKFRRLAERLADELVRRRIECVVGDAAEGCILAHDLLRGVRRAAVREAEARRGRPIAHFEFVLDSHPATCPESAAGGLRRLRLSADELADKIAAAEEYVEVRPFVQAALREFGAEAFADEWLFPCVDDPSSIAKVDGLLPYELHGRRQVEAGAYRDAIRFEEHVRPILESLGLRPHEAA